MVKVDAEANAKDPTKVHFTVGLDPRLVQGVLQAAEAAKKDPMSMPVLPVRTSMSDIGNKLIEVEPLPDGALPIYDKDPLVEAVVVAFDWMHNAQSEGKTKLRSRTKVRLKGFNPIW